MSVRSWLALSVSAMRSVEPVQVRLLRSRRSSRSVARRGVASRWPSIRGVAKQNVYDNPDFFAGYRNLRDNLVALHENVIQPMVPAIVPDAAGKRVVDLGCGEGFYCRIARAQGARHVVGIDPSEKMLAVAAERTDDDGITYVQAFAEDAQVAPSSADLVVSILALHYVEDFDGVVASVWEWLRPRGEFVLIVEHPVATAPDPSAGYTMSGEIEQAWLLSGYFDEGKREAEWYIPGVIKYHRRIDTMINALIRQGFRIEQMLEPTPSREVAAEHPRSRGDTVRPGVLGVRVRKPQA
jgi:SAM-dependent methyltransferase